MGRTITSSLSLIALVVILPSFRLLSKSFRLVPWADDHGLSVSELNQALFEDDPYATEQAPNSRRQRHLNRTSDWNPFNTSALGGLNNDTNHVLCTVPSGMTAYIPRNVPSFLIIGAQKGGTTALAEILSQHSQIESTFRREPHYFDAGASNYRRPLNPRTACAARVRYLQRNFEVTEHLTRLQKSHPFVHLFEKTPSYIRHPGAAKHVHQVLGPDLKILVVVRNPVDRCYSHYKMETQRKTHMAESFDKLISDEIEALRKAHLTKAIPLEQFDEANGNDSLAQSSQYTFELDQLHGKNARRHLVAKAATPRQFKEKPMKDSSLYTGMYATQLDEWIKFYPLGSHLMVVRSEELLANASVVLERVQAFLGVPPTEFHQHVIGKDYNPLKGGRGWREGAAIKVDPPSKRTLAYLKQFFEPHNRELATLLGDEWIGVWE